MAALTHFAALGSVESLLPASLWRPELVQDLVLR